MTSSVCNCVVEMATTRWRERIEDIRVPDTDTRKYRYLELLNRLKVVLISDEEAKKGAAALTVQAGYLNDPDDIPGLAHFCEHMLFLGTDKYPAENAYQEFLSQHGGTSNAFTAADRACYFFDVSHQYLRGALDRFVQFFLHPLFNESATEREVQAVDTENSGNLQVDTWRVQQVIHDTARPGHPFRKFGTGNKETLMSLPSSRGQDVRKELLEFHSKHYSSNMMGLAVLGKESLDELSDMVVELFSQICNKDIPVPIVTEMPFSADELQVCLEVVPVKHRRQLVMSFPLPDLQEHFRAKPVDYVSHLIGHEGQGSILSLLKAKGWCSALSAGGTPEARGFWTYSIECSDLTEEGEAHIEDMIEVVFQYIAMLRREGPKEWIFKECSGVHEIQFRYADLLPPNQLVMGVSDSILRYPPREMATGVFIMTEYRPELITKVLNLLTPQNLRYMVVSQAFAGKTDKVEPWYKVDYSIRKIGPELIERWSKLSPVDALHLPSKNEFIPTNFDLVPPPENARSVPVIIKEAPGVTVFHKVDSEFKVPKASFHFEFASPLSRQAPENSQLIGLYIHLLQDSLNEFAYAADIAGLEYNLAASAYGTQLTVAGYSDGLEKLLMKIVEKMTKLEVDQMKFLMYKDQMYRKLQNFTAEQPYSQGWYYMTVLLVDHCWRREELMTALEGLTAEHLKAFIQTFLSQLQITALAFGNVSSRDALRLVSQVQATLGCNPLRPGQLTRLRQVQIPVGSKLVYEAENTVHDNNSIEVYLQVGMEDVTSNMLLEVLVQVMKEPCFDQLRTKEQLGYLVHTSMRRANGAQGLQFLVQSPKHPAYVEGRIEAFLKKAEEFIGVLSDASFTAHCHALATTRLDKPKSFANKAKEYWTEITTGFYHFERDDVEVEHLRKTTKEDLIQFFKDHIAAGGQYRRKLAVRVHAQSAKNTAPGTEATDGMSTENVHSDVIVDVHKFKERQSLYPRPMPCVEPMRALSLEDSSHQLGGVIK